MGSKSTNISRKSTKVLKKSTNVSKRTTDILEILLESLLQDSDLDKELIRDCFPLKKPFSSNAREALLTVETRMKKKLKLPRTQTGIDIISDAQRLGVFRTGVPAEEDGIALLFRGSVMGIRNILSHNKIKMNKEESLKIILFADYLIKLFENLCKKNKIN